MGESKPNTAPSLRALPTILSVVFLVCFAYLAVQHFGDTRGATDVNIYRDIAERADAVFRGASSTVKSEYPPPATVLFWVANSARFTHDFAASWSALIVLAAVFAWAYLRCFRSRDALLFAAILPFSVLILGHDMIFARYDIFVAFALILSARAHWWGFDAESAFWLALGLSLKVVPILGVPLLLIATPRRQWGSLLVGAALGALLAGTISVGILGVSATLDNLRFMTEYHSGRPIQLESFWSGISMLKALLTNSVAHTGYNRMSIVNVDLGMQYVFLSKVFVLSGVVFLSYRAWKQKEARDFGMLLALALVWALSMSPVLSPQYFTWIIPLLLLILADRAVSGRMTARCFAAIVLTVAVAWMTKWIFPAHYNELISQHTGAVLMLNLRNFTLFALFYVLLTEYGLLPARPTEASPRVRDERSAFLVDTALVAVAVILFVGVRPMMMSSLTDSAVRVGDDIRRVDRLPVSVDGKTDTVVVATTLHITPLSERRFFRVRPDDCIEAIVINGRTLPSASVQFCDGSGPGRVFDFGPYLETGPNNVLLLVRNTGGTMGADLTPAVTPLLGLLLAIVILTFLWYVIQCWKFLCVIRQALPAQLHKMLYTLAALCSRSPSFGRLFFRIWRSHQARLSI